jgi:hypothetical protein
MTDRQPSAAPRTAAGPESWRLWGDYTRGQPETEANRLRSLWRHGFDAGRAEAGAAPAEPALDDDFRDLHEQAMQNHILDPHDGWPHTRLDPPLNTEGKTKQRNGCDDLCSDDIVDRLARLHSKPDPEPAL